MESFLRSVKTTARGPILDEINGYFKNTLMKFDNFIRGRSDKIQTLVSDNWDADHAAIQECLGRLVPGLQATMCNSACLIASALVAPYAFSPSGQRIHENDESRAEETKLRKDNERLMSLEFERLYGEVKQKKNSNKQKFHASDTRIAKKYKERVDEEDVEHRGEDMGEDEMEDDSVTPLSATTEEP
ncbi:uncharacterized protein K444DRAFT_628275 [Hyaloscypha bicolor E]|uniref:Uncharacterized protein n=1 Tax=Hyaloscypha bicolor E TaxID=1095630 RepID=A0A2J6TDW6_9HELO|nr:uncharacterized protein K444DRAFT_628275 [Hyaloscypha bicolor E]PMD61192.1 hypothetical protein K444DRAFT_628275 [Hyaloscypha bicolor E]